MFYCEQSPVKLKGGGGEEKPDAAWNELSATRRKLGNLMEDTREVREEVGSRRQQQHEQYYVAPIWRENIELQQMYISQGLF